MTSTTTIDILLATYNGEKYLKQQLDSILLQSYGQWRVIARDDASCDRSGMILNEYQKKFPEQFHVISDNLGNVGILQNFSILMQHCTASYVVLCDQDDIWLSEKLSMSLKSMRRAEQAHLEIPLLVHSDLKVVDSQLNIVADSFWRYQNLNPKLDGLNRLLVQNTVTGCTVMINRALLTLAYPIPKQAIMHDWWLGLVASAFGKIIVIDQPTVIYRQHEENDTGAKEWSLSYIMKQALSLRHEIKHSIRRTQWQAKVFYERFTARLMVYQQHIIVGYVDLEKKKRIARILFLFKNRLLKQGVVKNIALFLWI